MEFYRYYSKHTTGRVTLIAQVIGKNIAFAASRCSAADNFSKKEGFRIAKERFYAGKFCYSMTAKEVISISSFTRVAEYLTLMLSLDPRLLETEDFTQILKPLLHNTKELDLPRLIVPDIKTVQEELKQFLTTNDINTDSTCLRKNCNNPLSLEVKTKLEELRTALEKNASNKVNIIVVF